MRKVYKVALPFLLFNYIVILVLLILALLLFFVVFLNPAQKARMFAGLWSCPILVFALPYGLQIIHTISLEDSGQLIFKSLLFRKSFVATDLMSITSGVSEGYFLHFKFKKGKITVLNSVRNLSELIMTIKGINPGVKTKGLQS